MRTFPAPDPLHGAALAQELRDAGIDVADEAVSVSGDTLEVATDAPEADVKAVVDAHTGQPPPDPKAQEDEAWRDAIRNANSLAELKAVLAGDADVPGQAARRPSSSVSGL